MKYTYSKIEIEDVGIFTIPKPVMVVITEQIARAEAAEAEVARLKVVPQKINDAIWQYRERDDDGMIDIDNITAIIAKIAGDGSLGDDSLWFTGEQWATVVGDLDEARAEIARLRSALELAAQ